MNEVINNIKTRRSVRKFKPDMLPATDIMVIAEAGLYAPSTKGRQDIHVLIIKGLEKINKLNALVKEATAMASTPEEHVYAEKVLKESYSINFTNAPVFMVVTSDTKPDSNTDADGAVVLQTMFLAAHSIGIGSVWINQLNPISNIPVLRRFLSERGVPESYRIVGCAAFGYNAGEHPITRSRKENLISVYE